MVFITKINYFFIFIIIIGVVAVTAITLYKTSDKQVYTLYYCPTMSKYVQQIDLKEISVIQSSSSAKALSFLKSGQADMVIIGRKAYNNEIDKDTKEYILKKGYTLVAKSKGVFDINEINNFKVHTHHDLTLSEIIFSSVEIVQHQNIDDTLKNMGNDIALISWEEYEDDERYDLLITMDGNEKVENFRTPILYYKKTEKKIERIKEQIKAVL